MQRPTSLGTRLLLTLSLLAAAFLLVAAIALDQLYQRFTLDSRRDVLDAQILALLATAETNEAGQLQPVSLAEPRLATPASGLYAAIRTADGGSDWRSPSLLEASLPTTARPAAGERIVERITLADGTQGLALSLGIRWDVGDGGASDFTLVTAESLVPYQQQLVRFRSYLAIGSVVGLGILLVALVLALRVTLSPLRRLEAEITAVEAGERERLADHWPREIAGVASNLNGLLDVERARLERYRNTLGNLAHSLKTPLAALDAVLPQVPQRETLAPLLARMRDIIEHQLRRATLGSAGGRVAALPLAPAVAELQEAFGKIYAGRGCAVSVGIDPALAYPIERGDWLELLGNVIDNACKYGRGKVSVSVKSLQQPGWRRPGVVVLVDDDGPGIPVDQRERVLRRGERADEREAGQGIGLAASQEIVAAYGGSLAIEQGELGGARIRIELPGR